MTEKSALKFFIGALFVICAGVWSVVYAQTPLQSQGGGVLVFAVLDIGQGDSLYIESPTGLQVLIDGGQHDGAVLRALPQVMPPSDRSLDAVVATHPDADHIGGLINILERYSVGAFIELGVTKESATAQALQREVNEQKIPRVIARRGMTLDLGGGARLDVLYPDKDVSNFGERNNEGGIVLRLVYGHSEALLMADVSEKIENYLLRIASSTELRSDLLKVGHHGSKYSTNEQFVERVAPQMALISVGAKNAYGHPTPRVLETLAVRGVEVLRTDKSGTIMCRSDGAVFSCD